MHYFNQNLDYLKQSAYFKDEYSNLLGLSNYTSKCETFNALISKIEDSPTEYIENFNEYENILKYLSVNSSPFLLNLMAITCMMSLIPSIIFFIPWV